MVAVNVSPLLAHKYKMNIVSIAMRSYHFMFRANTFPEREKADLLICLLYTSVAAVAKEVTVV